MKIAIKIFSFSRRKNIYSFMIYWISDVALKFFTTGIAPKFIYAYARGQFGYGERYIVKPTNNTTDRYMHSFSNRSETLQCRYFFYCSHIKSARKVTVPFNIVIVLSKSSIANFANITSFSEKYY